MEYIINIVIVYLSEVYSDTSISPPLTRLLRNCVLPALDSARSAWCEKRALQGRIKHLRLVSHILHWHVGAGAVLPNNS